MSYGKKCNIIFVRKVGKRLHELEEKYKGLTVKKRAAEISKELLHDFCVDERQIQRWKQIVETADNLSDIDVGKNIVQELRPTSLYEIARLPKEKQVEVAKEVIEKQLTTRQTKALVKQMVQPPTPKLPNGEFDIIYADPPWKYNVDFLNCSPNQHYATMEVDEICAMNIPSNKNAVLFLWATNPFLEDALNVMKAWGFAYKSNLVWVKDRMGVGYYVRGQHELLLIGVKGDVHPPEESVRPPSVLQSPVREHSQKPDEVYSMIEHMYPDAKYLELFARQKRQGWVSWGNEI